MMVPFGWVFLTTGLVKTLPFAGVEDRGLLGLGDADDNHPLVQLVVRLLDVRLGLALDGLLGGGDSDAFDEVAPEGADEPGDDGGCHEVSFLVVPHYVACDLYVVCG